MKILIPTGDFPPAAGGPATYVPRLATFLTEQGHQVEVATLTPAKGHLDNQYPFRVHRLEHGGGRLRRWINVVRQLRVLLNSNELVYVNGLLVEIALTNRLTRRPMIAKVVGDIAWERARDKGWISEGFDIFQHKRYGWGIELRRWLQRWALRQMAAIIVPSAYLRKIVSGWGIDPQRIHVIYNAFEPSENGPSPVKIGLNTSYRLITVCRLVNWKGVDELIKIVAQLTETGLIVVGDGPERSRLETLAYDLGVSERVCFTGQVPRAEVPAYLKAADLFVLNSRYEGLPHVVLEALAAGKPVVATSVGGTPEVVQHGVNGLLVPPGDSKWLGEAVQEMLTHTKKFHSTELPEKFSQVRMLSETIALLEFTGKKPQ